MSKNLATKHQRQFLVTWSGLNLLGWIIGIVLVVLIQLSLEDVYEFSAWRTFLIWLPLGASIGIFQWFKLRPIGINGLAWAFMTALGGSILVTFFSWIVNFSSFDYWKYNIPYWVINTSSALAMPIGGAIIGGLQSLVLRNHVSRLSLWIKAYVFGLALLAISATLVILFKSWFLHFLYFLLDLFYPARFISFLIDVRWILFIGFLLVVTTLCISLMTGKVLLKQSTIDSVPIKPG